MYVAPINFSFMTTKMMYNIINSKEAFINKTELQRLHCEHKAVLQKIPDGAMIYQSQLNSKEDEENANCQLDIKFINSTFIKFFNRFFKSSFSIKEI
jgi:hypothetical protein